MPYGFDPSQDVKDAPAKGKNPYAAGTEGSMVKTDPEGKIINDWSEPERTDRVLEPESKKQTDVADEQTKPNNFIYLLLTPIDSFVGQDGTIDVNKPENNFDVYSLEIKTGDYTANTLKDVDIFDSPMLIIEQRASSKLETTRCNKLLLSKGYEFKWAFETYQRSKSIYLYPAPEDPCQNKNTFIHKAVKSLDIAGCKMLAAESELSLVLENNQEPTGLKMLTTQLYYENNYFLAEKASQDKLDVILNFQNNIRNSLTDGKGPNANYFGRLIVL